MSGGSYFNEEQQEHMRELAATPPEALCWCGWYDLGKCPNGCNAYGLSAAEKIKDRCPDPRCQASPSTPGAVVIHTVACSSRRGPPLGWPSTLGLDDEGGPST